jgi:drug/metabolite transporter (DMT)-like permease
VGRGVLLAVAAALLYNTGFVLQKAGYRRDAGSGRPLWTAGLAATTAGLCCQVLALSRLPLTVAQPIALCGVVVLLVLSRFLLGERAAARTAAGLALVVCAMVLVIASLDPAHDRPGTGGRPLALAAVAVPSTLVALTLFTGAHTTGRGGRAAGTGTAHGLAAGLLYGVAGLAAKGMAVVVGQLRETRGVWSAAVSPYLYLLVATTGLGFVVFQSGLRRYPASIVVPVSNVVANLHAIAAGTVVFGERLPASPVRLALRATGFTAATAALVLLSTGATTPAATSATTPAATSATTPAGRHRSAVPATRFRRSSPRGRARHAR